MKHAGIVREAGSTWRSVDDDPQFLIGLSFIRPAYCLFSLESLGEALDPVIYFDRGEGLTEADAVSLKHPGSALYVVPLRNASSVKRIRLDPATSPVKFRFWYKAVYRQGSLAKILANVAREANEVGRSPPAIIYTLPPSTIRKSGRSGVARSVAEHYRHVISLAASTPAVQSTRAPRLSFVVPTYNTKPEYLEDLVNSYLAQSQGVAELIFSDDGSTTPKTLEFLRSWSGRQGISMVPSSSNTGIAAATNRGIAAAQGEWVSFIDHDDAFSPHALERVSAAMQLHPAAKFFYTDEVIADAGLRPVGYLLKPAFDPVLLSGVNYINHLSFYRRDRLVGIGGLRGGVEGSQDYDLLLRYLQEVSEDEIVHIPYPAYLWRRGPATYSITHRDQSLASARRALAEAYGKAHPGISVVPALDDALHRPRFDEIIENWPLISVVIPSRDSFELISRILEDLCGKTDYPAIEILVVDNGSTDPRVLGLYDKYSAGPMRFRALVNPEPFNFARQVNRGIRMAEGRHVLLLNNDIEVLSSDWLREMVSCLSYPNTGIVGAMLLYPDRTIQHAGVIVGFGGLAGHWYQRKPANFPGPFARLRVRQSMSAVTGACMLISGECIDFVGELDERHFAVAYNDVDYCLRAAEKGFRTVWTPFATLIHHESVSRGSDESAKNRERFAREKAALRELHGTSTMDDPSINPWYARSGSSPGLALLSVLPPPRVTRSDMRFLRRAFPEA